LTQIKKEPSSISFGLNISRAILSFVGTLWILWNKNAKNLWFILGSGHFEQGRQIGSGQSQSLLKTKCEWKSRHFWMSILSWFSHPSG
jgi:hypothetical protein